MTTGWRVNCDFCNTACEADEPGAMIGWSSVAGAVVDVVVSPVGPGLMRMSDHWLSCPICTALITKGSWDELVHRVMVAESCFEPLYEALLRSTYAAAFNQPQLIADLPIF